MPTAAGFWRRLGAYTIDVVPISLLIAGVAYLFLGFDRTWQAYSADRGNFDLRLQFLIERNRIRDSAFLVWLVYSALMEASPLQGTLGKYLMRIRVVGPDGGRLTLARSIGRNLAKLLSYLPLGLGFLWAVFSKKKRTWHDMLAKTDVVSGAPSAPGADGTPRRRYDVSALPVLGLDEYRKILAHIPPPTVQQIDDFVFHVSQAKSWYKHLPLRPPGVPFTFYLDPWAGLDRVLQPDGRVVHLHRTNDSPRFHYTWMTTEEYRSRFGRLAFACAAGSALFTPVSVQLHDNRKVTGVFDNNPCRASIHLAEDREFQLPREVLEAGTTPVTGAVHKLAVRTALRSGAFRSDASEKEIDELLAPERRRLQEEMALAIDRVVILVYGRRG